MLVNLVFLNNVVNDIPRLSFSALGTFLNPKWVVSVSEEVEFEDVAYRRAE